MKSVRIVFFNTLLFHIYHLNVILRATYQIADAGIGHRDALQVLQVARTAAQISKQLDSKLIPVQQLLQNEQNRNPIVTFCAKLDEVLGGGIPLCKLTEFCGPPGIGKTQLW